jgi:hypothetical protein
MVGPAQNQLGKGWEGWCNLLADPHSILHHLCQLLNVKLGYWCYANIQLGSDTTTEQFKGYRLSSNDHIPTKLIQSCGTTAYHRLTNSRWNSLINGKSPLLFLFVRSVIKLTAVIHVIHILLIWTTHKTLLNKINSKCTSAKWKSSVWTLAQQINCSLDTVLPMQWSSTSAIHRLQDSVRWQVLITL